MTWLQAMELASIGLVAGAATTVSGIGGALIAVAATSAVTGTVISVDGGGVLA